MTSPIWDSFETEEDEAILKRCSILHDELKRSYAEEKEIFQGDEEEIANLKLILKTAQIERKRIEETYKKLRENACVLKRTVTFENVGGEDGPTITCFNGFDVLE